MVFVDVKGKVYIYNAVTTELVGVPDPPMQISGLVWDSNLADRNIFLIYNDQDIFTYIYIKFNIHGKRNNSTSNSLILLKI